MNRLLFFVLLNFLGIKLIADPSIQSAYQSFSQGRFEVALLDYQSLLLQHGSSSDLYYNLGLCHLNLHRLAEAKVNFEKALLLSPGSKNIKLQLTQINQSIEPKIEALPPFFLYKWFNAIRNSFNKTQWGWIVFFLSMFTGIIGIIKYYMNRPVSLIFQQIIFSSLICGMIFFISRLSFENLPRAILMKSTPLKIAPDANAQELLPLGSGTNLEVIDSLQGWYKIQLENNDQGWLLKQSIEKI